MLEFCEPCKKVMVGIPTARGEPTAGTMMALVSLHLVCQQIGIECDSRVHSRDPYIDRARNALVAEFLKSDATDLLFLDDDVSFETLAPAKILTARRPFIAAVYPRKQDEESFPISVIPGLVQANMDGHVEVAMVPTGFLRLNRAVFQEMPYVKYEHLGQIHLGFFQSTIIGKVERGFTEDSFKQAYSGEDPQLGAYIGEDVVFCKTWRDLGGKIFVIPNLTMWHTGPKTWEGNLHNHWMKTLGGGEE